VKKILLLVPQNVIPATDGGKIGIYKPMQMLAEEFTVKALIFIGKNEKFDAAAYKKIKVDAVTAPVNKKDNIFSAIFNIGANLPFKFSKYYSKKHKALIEDICNTWKPDILICHHAHLANYCEGLKNKFPSILLILREHNVEYLLVEQYYRYQGNFLLRLFAFWQYKKTKSFEIKCWEYFDKVAFISDTDFRCFRRYGKTEGYTIYDGTDNIAKNIAGISEKSKAFLFSGSLGSYQNKINLYQFIHFIWIPWKKKFPASAGYELWITGDRDKQSVATRLKLNAEYERLYNICILGFVDDIAAVMQKAQFFLSPTIIGAGIRIKVLEALGLGCVIFLTEKDLDISAELKDEKNVLLYHSLTTFNNKFEKVLAGGSALYYNIAEQAVITADKYFTWNVFYKKLKKLFPPLT